MNITVVCIGTLKEKYWKDAQAEYLKRLSRFAKMNILELPESRTDDVHEESSRILAKIPKNATVIALDITGRRFSSVDFAKEIALRMPRYTIITPSKAGSTVKISASGV